MAGAHRSMTSATAALFCIAAQLCGAAESEECRSLGFTGLQLCSDCDTLASYVKDDELAADCQRCCTRGKDTTAQKYTSAVLHVWLDRISVFPHIEGFVNNEAHKFAPALEIQDRFGVAPRLVMSAPGLTKKSVPIDGWKTEHVVEWLNDMLDPAAAEEEDVIMDAPETPATGGKQKAKTRETYSE